MSKDWEAYARHIHDTVEKIERIQQRGDLAQDEVLYDATLRNLQTLSEATQRLPDSVRRINEIVLRKRSISADTALRLARAFGTSEQFWMGLQADYDLEEARKAAAGDLRRVRPLAA